MVFLQLDSLKTENCNNGKYNNNRKPKQHSKKTDKDFKK